MHLPDPAFNKEYALKDDILEPSVLVPPIEPSHSHISIDVNPTVYPSSAPSRPNPTLPPQLDSRGRQLQPLAQVTIWNLG